MDNQPQHHAEAYRESPVVATWIIGLAGLSLFVILVSMLLTWGDLTTDPTVEAQRAMERAKNLSELRAEDEKALNQFAVLDKANGIYQITLERAMELEVATLSKKPVTQGAPITAADLAPTQVQPPVAVRE